MAACSLVLKILCPILPEHALPGDRVFLTKDGRTFLVREIPSNPGRWLRHLTDGVAEGLWHSPEQTLAALAARQTPRKAHGVSSGPE